MPPQASSSRNFSVGRVKTQCGHVPWMITACWGTETAKGEVTGHQEERDSSTKPFSQLVESSLSTDSTILVLLHGASNTQL